MRRVSNVDLGFWQFKPLPSSATCAVGPETNCCRLRLKIETSHNQIRLRFWRLKLGPLHPDATLNIRFWWETLRCQLWLAQQHLVVTRGYFHQSRLLHECPPIVDAWQTIALYKGLTRSSPSRLWDSLNISKIIHLTVKAIICMPYLPQPLFERQTPPYILP